MSSPPTRPEDSRLAEVAGALEGTGCAAMLVDAEWSLVWVSPELKTLVGEEDEDRLGYGKHILSVYLSDAWCNLLTPESQMASFFTEIPMYIEGTPGGKETIYRLLLDATEYWDEPPEPLKALGETREEILGAVVDQLQPIEQPPVATSGFEFLREDLPAAPINQVLVRLHDRQGERYGSLYLYDPGLPARVLDLVARGDHGMLERMARLIRPGRRQAAILFADLQASAEISRRLPSAAYFKLIRTLTTEVDGVVVRHGGIVGKHAGDGVTAFFLTEDLDSPSSAARAAIEAARDIAEAAGRVAKEVGEEDGLIDQDSLHINVGVHWGGTLYMGQLVTGGRLEVTALGDAVNEAARIQQSARDGEGLASKALIEHLSEADARVLQIDPDNVVYRTVGELPGATEKAQRDAGAIPVTVL